MVSRFFKKKNNNPHCNKQDLWMQIIDKTHPSGKLNKKCPHHVANSAPKQPLFMQQVSVIWKKVNIYRDTAWVYLWIIK